MPGPARGARLLEEPGLGLRREIPCALLGARPVRRYRDPGGFEERRKPLRKEDPEKRAAYESRLKKNSPVSEDAQDSSSPRTRGPSAFSTDFAGPGAESARKEPTEGSAFPPGATMCGKCNTNAVILMDGCATCLNCGY